MRKSVEKDTVFRRIKWLFSNSGIMALALEHFLAMVPATILVPILVNNSVGVNIIDMSLVLFTSGLGTILFSLAYSLPDIHIRKNGSGKRIEAHKTQFPAYLGSSFAYISLTIYLIDVQANEGIAPAMAYQYVSWSYLFSGLLLVLLSFLYQFRSVEKFLTKCLPAAVIGPAISLIGLELSDSAIMDSGYDPMKKELDFQAFTVAAITLVAIILFSLIKRKVWKNAAIIIGMIMGVVAYCFIFGVPSIDWNATSFITVPDFHLPPNPFSLPESWPRLFISVIPATLIVFTENIGRVTVINRMKLADGSGSGMFDIQSVKVMGRALRAHGLSSMAATFLGSVPNTLYAENIAVMGMYNNEDERDEPDTFIKKLTNPFSVIPYWIAAGFAILVAFFGPLQSILLNIPKPVIGGMELFLFGIISAPGIQLLVEQKVSYKKVSNQIITAAVLITGISELSISIKWFELKGMSLGLVVGFLVNLVILFLNRMGILSDTLTIDEVLKGCLEAVPAGKDTVFVKISKSLMTVESIKPSNLLTALGGFEGKVDVVGEEPVEAEFLRDAVSHAEEIFVKTDKTIIKISKKANNIYVDIRRSALSEADVNMYLNDYKDAIDTRDFIDVNAPENGKEVDFVSINLSANIPLHRVAMLIKKIDWEI